jgi:hypothetical protein
MPNQDDTRTLAGMVATANAVAGKQIPLRNPLPLDLPRSLRPSTTADLPRLFRGNGDSPSHRVARLSSAALLYSVNKASTDKPSQLLVDKERLVLDDLHTARRDHLKDDRSCPHCRLLYDTLYNTSQYKAGHYVEGPKPPPIAVVNHSARVKVTFDPETNISTARINNFQLIVPTSIARKMLRLSHPLRWAEPPGALFRQSDAVNAKGERPQALQGNSDKVMDAWAREDKKYIYEHCVWPINSDLGAVSENIIAFDHFFNDESSLSYTYRLERSIRSNFGVAWERSGLDVDEGFYQALAVPLGDFSRRITLKKQSDNDNDDPVPTEPLTEIPVGQLRRRDVLELQASYDHGVLGTLYNGFGPADAQANGNVAVRGLEDREKQAAIRTGTVLPQDEIAGAGEDATSRAEIVRTVGAAGTRLAQAWESDFCVVNISASKRLHFTVPENAPIELWQLLTLTAPAFLFTFLNSAICLAPHVLVDTLINPSHEDLAHAVQ